MPSASVDFPQSALQWQTILYQVKGEQERHVHQDPIFLWYLGVFTAEHLGYILRSMANSVEPWENIMTWPKIGKHYVEHTAALFGVNDINLKCTIFLLLCMGAKTYLPWKKLPSPDKPDFIIQIKVLPRL